jgi:iron(III) transport system substrate-binding protein
MNSYFPISKLIGFSAALLLLPLFAKIAPSHAAEEKPRWEMEWDKTLKAAEKDGPLSIYVPGGDFEKVIQAFQKKYPSVKVSPVPSGLDVAVRILAERRAEKYLADIVVTGPGTPYYVLYKAKALDPIKAALIFPEVLDESKWWEGRHHYVDPEREYVFVFIGPVSRGSIFYNTKLVNPQEFKSYRDLLNPKWKAKIVSIDTRIPGAARLGLREIYHVPQLGPDFIRRLFTEMDVAITRDERQAVDWLSIGKFALCLFCTDARNAKKQGLPLDEFDTTKWLETPTVSPGGASTIVLLNRAPHPNAAKLFINWLLSREGQTNFQNVMNTPDTLYESMRADIPKDSIPAEYRRKEGVKYVMMATPERADHAPVEKLLKEIFKP